MTKATAQKIARAATTADVQKWSSSMGRFVAGLHPLLNEKCGGVCNLCPFRNNHSLGGCIGEDCPLHAVRHALQRVMPRTTAAVRDICKARYAVRCA